MSDTPKVLIYGFSGYTGKLIGESLAKLGIPFYAAGRNEQRLLQAMEIVEERFGGKFDAQVVTSDGSAEELLALFEKVDVVINVVGPFMQLAWPVVEAALQANCHYLDTTGEQDFALAVKQTYGQAFADKGLLVSPANSFMWAAGALAAEVCLENEGVDTLDLVYQIDNGLPSEASTKSFLRMVCNDVSQYHLEQNELRAWPNDKEYPVSIPYSSRVHRTLPWGGGCEPIWYMDDPRVLNCSVLTAPGDHLVDPIMQAIKHFNSVAKDMSQEERENLTNAMGDQMDTGEPPKDDVDIQRCLIVCNARGRQTATQFAMLMAAPYTWTGEVCAEAAKRLLGGQLKKAGFQSAATAFGHRKLLEVFHASGYCSLPE